MPELLFVPPLAGARTNELIAEHMRTRGVFLVYYLVYEHDFESP